MAEPSDKNTTNIFQHSANPDEVVQEFTRRQNDMAESMQRVLRFQRETLALKNTQSDEDAFDSMESLLIDVIDFAFVTLQFSDANGGFSARREIRPDSLALDYSLLEWVLGTQEVSVLPISIDIDATQLRSLIFLPFGPNYVMLLWLEQEADQFTREQEALLSVLSREMAAVLESHEYHDRLEKTRAAMSDIIESVPLGLLALDSTGMVEMINSTAEIALSVRRADSVGKNYHEALPQNLVMLLDRMIAEKSSDEEELVVSTAANEEQYLGVTVSPMQGADGSNRLGHVVVCRDLQLSREVQKLRQLDMMKNDFLSLVSHELRTPLTSILAYSETLIMDDNEHIPQEWREYIDIIHSEGKRLSRLIDDVLDLTKMEAGKMNYDFTMQDPNDVIGNVIMTLMPLAEAKSHEIDIDLAEDIGDCRLAVDRFTQVANNIISNAIKYTNPGGKIHVRTYRSGPLPGSAVATFTMEVEDNGVGISQENLDKVFSKFEMVEAIKNHSAGTGLGMAICKQIVEEGHSGRIWLDSEVDVGTKVYVQIPVQ